MIAIALYRFLTWLAAPVFEIVLLRRLRLGKENPDRVQERKGIASRARPQSPLIWLHAASVGEAQSALIVMRRLLLRYSGLHILVTTGTVTSAQLMEKNLPDRAFHQFYPIDHPQWTRRFIAYWKPDFVLWMESELWPNMMAQIARAKIPAVLLNGRMSERSARRWGWLSGMAARLLRVFSILLVQTDQDAAAFKALGYSGSSIHVTGNVKYNADPLPRDPEALQALAAAIGDRPCWVYASTHAGEESLACAVHGRLCTALPNLLTIIVPRHPERGAEIAAICDRSGVSFVMRGGAQPAQLPLESDAVYIADTLGELGLFYSLAPIAVIGRSFSDDGGGGHNPIEAAQLGAAVLSGPDVQYQAELFNAMAAAGAAIIVPAKDFLAEQIGFYLRTPDALKGLQERGTAFVADQGHVLRRIEDLLFPMVDQIVRVER